jgi:hypothetical protein
MTFGTPIGAIHPNQACTSKPFNVSAKVGISGLRTSRAVTALPWDADRK